MAKVTFRNIFEEESEFVEIDRKHLLPCVNKYAVELDNPEVYNMVMKDKVVLFKNGKAVLPDDWVLHELEKDDEIVIVPAIGDLGDIGAFIMIGIGAALIAIGVGIPVGAAILGFEMTAGAKAIMLGLGLSFALGGVSYLLFKPTMPTLPYIGSDSASNTYNWAGITTTSNTDSVIPLVYGTHPVGGNIISLFTESEGNENYLYMLSALGEGEIEGICQKYNNTLVCTTSDYSATSYRVPAIELNDQPIDSYEGVSWWYRTGTNAPDNTKDAYDPTAQNKIPHFDGAKVQYADGRELDTSGVVYETNSKIDMAKVDINIPALYSSTTSGIQANTVKFKIEYKKHSDPTYTTFPIKIYGVGKKSISGGTFIQNASFNKEYLKYKIDTMDDADGYVIVITRSKSLVFTHFDHPDWTSYHIDMEIAIYDTRYNYIGARTIKTSGRGTGFSLPWLSIGNYNFQLVRPLYSWWSPYGPKVGDTNYIYAEQTGTQNEISITSTTKTGIKRTYYLDFTNLSNAGSKDLYDIKITRTDGGRSLSLQAENNAILSSVTEIIQGDFLYPNTALLALRIKASGQLSGNPPNVVTLVKGLKIPAPDHSGSEPFDDLVYNEAQDRYEYNGNERTWDQSTFTEEHSNNSMLCLRDLVLKKRYGLGEYILPTDISNTSVVNETAECHKSWVGYSSDICSWWTDSDISMYDSIQLVTDDITVNEGNRRLELDGNRKQYTFNFKLNTDMEAHQRHDIQFTLASLASYKNRVAVEIWSARKDSEGLINKVSRLYTGNHVATVVNASITPRNPGSGYLEFNISTIDNTNASDVSCYFSNVSVQKNSTERMHTWNGVLDTPQSALAALYEMSDSFRCWPIWLNGKFNFKIDKDETPVHTIAVSNMNSFSQNFTPLSQIPSKLNAQFTDEDIDYNMRNITAISDSNKLRVLNERTIGLKGITNSKRASRELSFKLNKVTNQNHQTNFSCGLDMIHCVAGDIVNVSNDLPSWGHGGRVLNYELGTTPQTASMVINGTILAYWPMDENTGATVFDQSGNSYHGVFAGNGDGPEWTEGVFNSCLEFDGDDFDRVDVATRLPNLGAPNYDFSIAWWRYHTTSAGWDAPFGMQESGTNYMEINGFYGPLLGFAWVSNSKNVISQYYQEFGTINNWSHHVITVDRKNRVAYHYLNGVRGTPYFSSASILALPASDISINATPGIGTWDNESTNKSYGKIEDMIIYNKVLNATEALAMYNQRFVGDRIVIDTNPPSFPSAGDLIKYQTNDNSFVTATIMADKSDENSIYIDNFPQSKYPAKDGIFTLGSSSSYVKPFRLLSTVRQKEDEVECVGIEHIASIYTEGSIQIFRGEQTGLPNPLTAPNEFSIKQLDVSEGIGFEFYIPNANRGIPSDAVIEMAPNSEGEYRVVSMIPSGSNTGIYKDSSIRLNTDYFFRAAYKTNNVLSGYIYSTAAFDVNNININTLAVKGVKIKDRDPNSSEFTGRDVTITWNAVGQSSYIKDIVSGYKIEVFKAEPTDNLIGYWPLNEGSGTTAEDESIYDNHGTLEANSGTPQYVDGRVGSGVEIVQADVDRIDVGNSSPLDNIGKANWSFSTSFWFKPTVNPSSSQCFTKYFDSDNQLFINCSHPNSPSNGTFYTYWYKDGVAELSSTIGAGKPIVVGTWYHIVVIFDRANGVSIYLDNILLETDSFNTAATTDLTNTGNVAWGGMHGGVGGFANCVIDECMLYNGILSSSEVNSLYEDAHYGRTVYNYEPETYPANLLRTEFVTDNQYTYKLENHYDDSTDAPHSSLVFKIYSLILDTKEGPPAKFKVENSTPSTITNLQSMDGIGGVSFSWNEAVETDVKEYEYKYKLASNDYIATWTITESNYTNITLSATELNNEGLNATIFFKVRKKDLYNLKSFSSSTSAVCNLLPDNTLIKSVSVDSGITGTTASLYDGTTDSGGVTI